MPFAIVPRDICFRRTTLNWTILNSWLGTIIIPSFDDSFQFGDSGIRPVQLGHIMVRLHR